MSIELVQEAIDRGVQRAQEWLGRQVQGLPGIRDLRQLSETLHQSELELEQMRVHLIALRDRGLAHDSDYRVYEAARQNMFTTHQRFRNMLGRVFQGHPEVLGQLPSAKHAPKVTPSFPPRGDTVSGLLGLGNPAAAAPAAGAAAAAGAPAWMMAAIVLIILASIVLAITLVVGGIMLEEVVRDVVVTKEQLAATREAWARRQDVYDRCLDEGGTPAVCGSTAAMTVPMPPEVARELPRPGGWVKWVTIGLITVTVAGFGIWGISKLRARKKRRTRSMRGPVAGSYRPMSSSQFLASDGGDYHMEDVD